jgi:nicotinate-nucleotide adenylyltransferase
LIGILGGSFDPIHLGHIAAAEELLRRFPFQEIRFLPTARSPLKASTTASNTDRKALVHIAIRGKERLTLDDRELTQAPPNYSIDTLQTLRTELGPEQPLVFILGMDSFLELPRWKNWQQLTDYAHLLVVNRPGHPPVFSPELADWLEKHRITGAQPLESRALGGVLLVEMAPYAVASRDIRAAILAGRDTSHWLNPAVQDYIDQHHLYSGDVPPHESA